MRLTITSISASAVELGLRDGLRTSIHDVAASYAYVLVRMQLSDGTVGFGEAPEAPFITGETAASMLAAIQNILGPALIGHDALDAEGLHRTMKRVLPSGNSSAKSAIDLAFYDSLGRHLKLPVSVLLGGAPRGPVPSSKAIGTGPVDEMVAAARRNIEQGYRTVKIKTGSDAASELAAVKAIREAGGPELNIKLDANQGWSLTQALRFLEKAERYDIQMVEQPLPGPDLKGAAELRRRTSIPVMLDESIHGPDDALRAIEIGACDFINIKLLKAGGLFPALAIIAVCEAGDVDCQIGCLSTSLGTAAALHLVHARSRMKYAEVNWPVRLAGDVGTGFRMIDGSASVEAVPGLGIAVDEGAFRAAA